MNPALQHVLVRAPRGLAAELTRTALRLGYRSRHELILRRLGCRCDRCELPAERAAADVSYQELVTSRTPDTT